MREGDLNAFGVERLLDTPVHFSSYPPLLNGFGLDPTLDNHG
jgi:hypothetical protein